MTSSGFRALVLIVAVAGIAQLAGAQQPPDTGKIQPTTPPETPTPVAAVPAPVATPPAQANPSTDLLKKARQNGYHTKVRNGATVFCKTEARLGTRFVTEKCMDEELLVQTFEQQELQRDQMRQSACLGGQSCGGAR